MRTTVDAACEESQLLVRSYSVIIAISQNPRNNLSGIGTEQNGLVISDEDGCTTRQGVFASGDVVTEAKPVAEAVSCSKRSAAAIIGCVNGKRSTQEMANV